MPLLKRPVFDKDLTPRQRKAAVALEKAAMRLSKLNKVSLKNIKRMFEDCGTGDGEVLTDQTCQTVLDHLIEEKGL